jgi:SAM-dependent methyltransferase
MTGFSAEWLALREPVDHQSRDRALHNKVVTYLDDIAYRNNGVVRLIDLGSGSGSNLRALAPDLSAIQHWTLVDYDPALLKAARAALVVWADSVLENSESARSNSMNPLSQLILVKQGKRITVDFLCEDLALNIEKVLLQPADLITAAAFFDLVARSWLDRFCNALTIPLYTVLTYNGVEKWSPPHVSDRKVLAAFHRHQQTDKGFGAAAGPSAASIMEDLLSARGFSVQTTQSPWLLNENNRSLIEQLASGSAAAALETKLIDTATAQSWEQSRREAQTCEIGHIDLFALPQPNK